MTFVLYLKNEDFFSFWNTSWYYILCILRCNLKKQLQNQWIDDYQNNFVERNHISRTKTIKSIIKLFLFVYVPKRFFHFLF